MPLSDDQKAMLRVLAQREEGYEDMAALMGISVEELRSRVKEALAEVDEEEAAPVAPPPPRPPTPPEPPAPATVSRAPEPAPPMSPAPPAPTASTASSQRGLSRLRLPKDRGALVGLGLGLLALIAMAIALAVSGSSSSSSGENSTTAESKNLTEAILSPVNGGSAGGRALFGRYKKNVLLQVEAEGLEPAPAGKAYTVWLYRSRKLSLQVGAVPERDGKIAAQLQIPAQLLAYVASGAFNQVDVSLTPVAVYKAALAKAKRKGTLPPHIGESILRGKITGPAIR